MQAGIDGWTRYNMAMDSHDDGILPLAVPLTGRELEVLTFIGNGLTNREIAEAMFLAASTIKWYVRQIYNKLGVEERSQAIERAIALGLLPELEAADRQRIHLPVQLTSFIGRRREISEVVQILRSARLATITGPGGSGKTRLAIRAAREASGKFDDGVYFVSLAAVAEPSMVPNAIAQQLEVSEGPLVSLLDSLKHFLRSRSLLLLLDNFEHLMDAAPMLVELLAASPRLTILVTSRETLRLSGEHEYIVPPLSTPDPSLAVSLAELSKFEAAALFVQRAAAASSSFAITDDDASVIAAICDRLDGLPLAIELAAARVKLFNPQQLLERLESRLDLLTGGPRDLPARQQTIRQTIDWSYELLKEDEKILFSRLGVFTGGRSLDAVQDVCSVGLTIGTLQGMASLLNKSLIYMVETPSAGARFHMLETIKEYANERLAEGDEENAIRSRHFQYFLNLMEEAEQKLEGSEQLGWLQLLRIEHDNLLTAAYWILSSKDNSGLALRMIGSLAAFMDIGGYYTEGRALLAAALDAEEGSRDLESRAKALRKAGLLGYMHGDYPATRSILEECMSIYRRLGPDSRSGLADALITYGDMETEVGNYKAASSSMLEALDILLELDDKKGIARAYWQLGACAIRPGDYEKAIAYFDKALPLLREIGDRTQTSIAISGLAEVAIRQGDLERAVTLEEESLAMRRELGDRWGVGVSLGNFGWIALRKNELDRAVKFLNESLTTRLPIGDSGGIAWCLEKLAEIAVIEALSAGQTGSKEEYARAATLYGAAEALRAPAGSVIDQVDLPDYERQVSLVKSNLDESNLDESHVDESLFSKSWNRGGEMSLKRAVAYALKV